jgi:hypothetical protein
VAHAAFTPTLGSTGHTETTITLSWTKSNDVIFEHYTVTYSTTVNGQYNTVATITDSSQTSYAVSGLMPETTYYFIVQDTASVILGSSTANSNTYQASTNSGPVLAITAQTATTASFAWSDSNIYSSLVTFGGYTLQMSTSGASGPFSTVATISNQMQTTYTITGLSAGMYYVRLFDTAGGANSYSNIVPVPILNLVISPNTPTTIQIPQQVEFSVSATGGSGSYNYQWYINGSSISGATSANYVLNPSPSDWGVYNINVEVQDAQYSTSQPTISPVVQATVIPENLSLTIRCNVNSIWVGQQIQFTASASGGTGSYNFKWYLNGVQTGTTSSTFILSPTKAGNYDVYATVSDATYTSLATANSNHEAAVVTTPPPSPELTLPIVLLALVIATCLFILVKVAKQKASKKPELT